MPSQPSNQPSNNAISVEVTSHYLPEQSDPAEQRFAFRYRICIRNQGNNSAQLLARHWTITDGNGKVEEVQGLGVVGEQPEIKPNSSYEYSSGCVLHTEIGCMKGYYEMKAEGGSRFKAQIPLFSLAVPNALH